MALSLSVARAHGQSTDHPTAAPLARGVVDAIVVDDDLRPITDASVSILGLGDDIVRTGENGRFRVTSIPPGAFLITIRRISYRPLITTVRIAPGDTARPSYTLTSAATTLDPVIVTDRAVPTSLLEFFERKTHSVGGQFMDANDIDRLRMVATSGLLQTFRGLTLSTDGRKVYSKRVGYGYGCPIQFFVDGVLSTTPQNVDAELPHPNEIAGIEVYSGPASVPPQYATLGSTNNGGAYCGVILIWTKR